MALMDTLKSLFGKAKETAGEAAETAAVAALQYARRSTTGVDIRI